MSEKTFLLVEGIAELNKQAKAGLEIIRLYRERVNNGAATAVFNAMDHKKELWKAYNIALRKFIEKRFGELATIGTSKATEEMEQKGLPVKVTGSGKNAVTRPSKPGNRQAFGLASDYLIEQIFAALLSDGSTSPGFRTLLEVSQNNVIKFDWEIRLSHFYKIPFEGGKVSYPKYLDDLLRADVPYISKNHKRTYKEGDTGPEIEYSKYVALGAHHIGLLGMTPAEREALDNAARVALAKILGTASSMKRSNQ